MNRLFDPCRRHRQNLSLLAAGVLPDSEKEAVEMHLSSCSGCRRNFEEIKTVTAPLENWAKNLPQLQPDKFVQRRWTKAIETAAQPEPVRRLASSAVFLDWVREAIWPWRRIWAGLAAVWLMILAGNVALREPAPAGTAKSAAPSQEAIASFRDQQKILADLLAEHSAPRDAERQKSFSPKPRTERFEVVAV